MKPREQSLSRVSQASAQGNRSYQEDRAVQEWIESAAGAGWLLAVFDGHRGADSAVAASAALPPLFTSHWTRLGGDAARAFEDVFRSLHDLTQYNMSGSTASLVFIPEGADSATIAVLGDSPVALLDSRGHAHMGPDHNVRTNLAERAAAEARGGLFRAGYLEDSQQPGAGLQMARVLGDADLARIIDRSPEIEVVPLGGKGVVLVGTDGLFLPESGTNAQQLKRLLELIQRGADAEAIVADALARKTGDNVTAIVWRKG